MEGAIMAQAMYDTIGPGKYLAISLPKEPQFQPSASPTATIARPVRDAIGSDVARPFQSDDEQHQKQQQI